MGEVAPARDGFVAEHHLVVKVGVLFGSACGHGGKIDDHGIGILFHGIVFGEGRLRRFVGIDRVVRGADRVVGGRRGGKRSRRLGRDSFCGIVVTACKYKGQCHNEDEHKRQNTFFHDITP